MGKPKNKKKGGLLKRMIILAAIHAVITIGLIVFVNGGAVVLFSDLDPAITGLKKTLNMVTRVLTEPAYSVWNNGLVDTVPQYGQWILFGLNSLLWGFVLAYIFGRGGKKKAKKK